MGRLFCTGVMVGVLTLLSEAAKVSGRKAWNCLCECGEESVITERTLRTSEDKGCRCTHRLHLNNKNSEQKTSTHGLRAAPEYSVWRAVKKRCGLSSTDCYYRYGGRGIKVCSRWQSSFENFIQDMGFRPGPNYSIDRIDVNGNYEPSNCRWAIQEVQSNNKRNSRYITFRGKTKTISQFAKDFGLRPTTVHGRINTGWSVEKALTVPIKGD